jgi:hypothetical protein
MHNLRKTLGVLLAILLVSAPLAASAAEQMAFAQKFIKSVRSGVAQFKTCASVSLLAPADGFVVVTASGMALFDSRFSDLTLTLKKKPASEGPWVFTSTPGNELTQSFTVRFVFPVSAGDNPTFFLNGVSANGPGGNIRVETGSMTAEFYTSANVQSEAPNGADNAPASKDGRTNAP